MIDYCQPPLGYLVRIPQESLDSALDGGARSRAEDAARFLSYERIGPVVSSHQAAAVETAEIIVAACSSSPAGPEIDEMLEESIYSYFAQPGATAAPCVLVCDPAEIRAMVSWIRPDANVCAEIVAPGGILSVHRVAAEGGCGPRLEIRARHMVLDFAFAEFVEMVAEAARAPQKDPVHPAKQGIHLVVDD